MGWVGGDVQEERSAGLPAFLHEGNCLVRLRIGLVPPRVALLRLVLVIPVVLVVVVEVVGLPVLVSQPCRPRGHEVVIGIVYGRTSNLPVGWGIILLHARSQVPLADVSRAVASGAEPVRQAVGVLHVAGLHEIDDDPGMGGIAPGLQHPAIGRAQRAGRYRIGEHHAFARQAIDVGRGDVSSAIDTAHVGPELVGKHEEDVGLLPSSQPTASRQRHACCSGCRQSQKRATVHCSVTHGRRARTRDDYIITEPSGRASGRPGLWYHPRAPPSRPGDRGHARNGLTCQRQSREWSPRSSRP